MSKVKNYIVVICGLLVLVGAIAFTHAKATSNAAPQVTFPRGIIIAWNAKSGAVPTGWAVCDGTNGTPDLRNRFLMGVATFADVGQTPGQNSHDHPFAGNTGAPGGVNNNNVKQEDGSPLTVKGTDHTHGFSGTTGQGNGSNIPPSYTVLYLMKL